MKIVMVSSEVAPYSKTGGLGEAVGGLAKTLASLGLHVTCIVPYYRCSWEKAQAQSTGMKLTVPIGQKQVTADIWEAVLSARSSVSGSPVEEAKGQGTHEPRTENGEPRTGSLQVVFVRRDEYYDRSELYGTRERDYEDNAERFIFLSKIAVEWIRVREWFPDVVHCHDWQTGLVPLLLRLEEQTHKVRIATKTVFTIHNLAKQGIFWSLDFPMTNLPWQFFTPEGLEFYGQMNLMKAGILFPDLLTTVSKRHAQEIQTAEFGCGLESPIKSRGDRLRGIVNGIDVDEWNPETDPHIARRFGAAHLDGKHACKQEVLRSFSLDGAEDAPLIGIVSRLNEKKGFDIVHEVLEDLLRRHVRIVLLGLGDAKSEKLWRDASKRHPRWIGARIGYEEVLAHQIMAGSDFLLMPSRFEPCGLNQMYSLRYGTIPIVHATGGLDDTIQDFDSRTGQGNGFKFTDHSGAALLAKCEGAMAVYGDRTQWLRLRQNAMACDVSWRQPAKEYLTLYEKG